MLYIMLAMLFYTGAIILSTFASRAINSNLVSAIVNTISAVIPVIVVAPLLGKKMLVNGNLGIIAAVLSGICIALFAMSLNKSFQLHKVALVSPMVFGGAIFLSAILSYFIFKEKLSPLHLTGLIVVGIGLLTIIYSTVTGK